MRRKLSEIQRPETPRGKSVISRLNRSPQGTNVKILSEDDFNTKKWLDSRIADINAREEAADTLRKQFEQQLALLNRKESLEKERSSMKGMRAVVTAGSKTVLSEEEEEALQEIEDRIESVEGQLKLRDRNISEIQSKLGRDISPQDGTVEALQSTVGSLPAAHELIALLFNMLVSSKSVSKQRKTALLRVEGKEKVLRVDLDEANKRMKATIRAHDMELTRSANEYEEKLLGLFSHSSIGQIVRMESELYPADTAESVQNAQGNFSTDDHYAMASQSFSLGPNSSLEPDSSHRIRIAATTEQSSLLKSKLERESRRNVELQIQNSELSLSGQRLQQELEEKAVYVKFLEDERTLFRDVADRLRAGISVLGGSAGEVILSQIKDDEDDDEDCEGFRGEFTNLGEIITRTGSVTERIFSDPRLSATAPGGTASGSRDIVYDRLTNPSNFTGAMKNAFGDDLAKKRQKVQQIKSSHPPKRLNGSGYDFKLSRVDSMRGSKETVNSNDGAPSTPTAADGSLPVPPSLSRRSSNQHLSRAVSSPDTNSARPASMSVIDIGRNRADRLAGASFSPSSSIKSSSDDSSVTSTASLAYHPGASPRGTPIKSKRSASATRGRRSSSSKSPTAPSDTEPDTRREKDASNSGLVSYELSLQQEDVTQIPPASPTALSSVTLSPRSFDETNTTGSNAAGNRTPEEAENPGGEGSSIPPPPMDDSSPNPKRSIGGMMKKLFGTRRKSNPDVSSDLPSFFPVPSASQKDDTQAAKSGLTHSKFLPSFSKKNRNGRDVEDPNQGGGSTPPSPSVQEEKDSNTEEVVVVEERIEEVEKEIIEEPNIEEPIPTPPLEDDTESPNTDISPHGNESSTNTTYDSWESGVQLTREEKQIQRVTSRLQSATSASPKGKVSPRASIPQAEGKKR